MKTYIYIILAILALSVYYLYHINKRQQNDIIRISNAIREQNIAKKDSLVNLIEQGRFKEDFYSTQLSLKSDWIILYVTVLFSIFGFIGVGFFIEKMNRLEHNLKNEFIGKIDKHEGEYHLHRKEFNDLKKELYILYANNHLDYAISSSNGVMSFLSYLLSSHGFLKAIEIEQNEELRKILIPVLLATLEGVFLSISKIDKNDESSTNSIKEDFNNIHEKIFEINKFNNIKSRELCAKIIVEINSFFL